MKTFALMLLAAWPLATHAGWTSSDSESALEFIARYQDTELPGRFRKFDVRLQFDPAAPQKARLEVTVRVDSADMGDVDLNQGIAGADFFDFEHHPVARFVATAIHQGADDDSFIAVGDLQLKGRTRKIEVPFEWRQLPDHAEMQGTVDLERGDFGIGSGAWAKDDTIAQRVEVRFRVTLHATP